MIKYFFINHWYCRLGNNIMQLVNALHLSLLAGEDSRVVIPEHQYFCSTDKVQVGLTDHDRRAINQHRVTLVTDSRNFYLSEIIVGWTETEFVQNYSQVVREIRQAFVLNPPLSLSLSQDKILVIHLRSGDIFGSHPHPKYIPPPWSYYQTVLSTDCWSGVILVCEDRLHPLLSKFEQEVPNLQFQVNKLEKDIAILTQASYLVLSIGTFVPGLIYFNSNIQRIFCPSYAQEKLLTHLPNLQGMITFIDLSTYRREIRCWRNTFDQRQRLLC